MGLTNSTHHIIMSSLHSVVQHLPEVSVMNQSQARQVELAKRYIALGHADVAARSISALIRCAMSTKAQHELLKIAQDLGVANHPEFII